MRARNLLRALIALGVLNGAQAAAAEDIRFITCPIYRDADAGRKSGCWLADDRNSGTRYDVGIAPTKPDWNHAVLVEGRLAADQKDLCGGVVLDPVRVSVLRDETCTRMMLPAEGFPGRPFVLPQRNLQPLYVPRPKAAAPFEQKQFVIPFDFDSDFVTYQLSDYYLDQAIQYALDAAPARVEIRGFAATARANVSGKVLAEPSDLARRRAERVAQWVRMRGAAKDADIAVSWKNAPGPIETPATDGLVAPSLRRVEITIVPQPR